MEIFYFDADAESPKLLFNLLGEGSPEGGTYTWKIEDTSVVDFYGGDPGNEPFPEFEVLDEGETDISVTYTCEDAGEKTAKMRVKTIAVTLFEDQEFILFKDASDIGSFLKKGPRMSRNFYKAFITLGKCVVIPDELPSWRKLYGKVADDVDEYFETFDGEGLKYLTAFIHYNVYKTGIGHLISGDEAKWARDLAEDKAFPKQGAKEREAEILKHYMCETRYTKRVHAFLRKDLPRFVYQVLRVHDTKKTFHIFQTSNGMSIAYNKASLDQDKIEIMCGEEILSTTKLEGSVEYVPFDPCKFMIVTCQVPVMSEPVTLSLPESKKLLMGKRPDDMGYQMSQEYAGAFHRSLNSQRVIEVVDFDDEGTLVLLQFKGAGVPEYGFDIGNAGNEEIGEFTGGEFFKLTAERGSMGLYDFGIEVFDAPNIAPNMAGMALVATTKCSYSGGKRTGAISFRLDYSGGIRVPNCTIPDIQKRVGVLFPKFELVGYQASVFEIIVKHFVIAGLFGMNYDDSSLKDLGDVGLRGEFSDSGSLRNIVGKIVIKDTTLVSQGIKTIKKEQEDFLRSYLKWMVWALRVIAGKMKSGDASDTVLYCAALFEKIWPIDFDANVAFFEDFCGSLGGKTSVITPCQKAFYDKDVNAYVDVWVKDLNNRRVDFQIFLCKEVTFRIEILRDVMPDEQLEEALTISCIKIKELDVDTLVVLYGKCCAQSDTGLAKLRRIVGTKELAKSDKEIHDDAMIRVKDHPTYKSFKTEEEKQLWLLSEDALLKCANYEKISKANRAKAIEMAKPFIICLNKELL